VSYRDTSSVSEHPRLTQSSGISRTGDEIEVRVSAVDHIPFLRNEKEAFVRLEGAVFGDVPVRIELSIQVPDAFNSAGVIVDAIRVAQWALSRGNGGVIHEAAAAFCKRPPTQAPDQLAYQTLNTLLSANPAPQPMTTKSGHTKPGV